MRGLNRRSGETGSNLRMCVFKSFGHINWREQRKTNITAIILFLDRTKLFGKNDNIF